ncbi:MAG: hypothetical protein N2111_08645 [Candidatus Sumerlaeaceae bacterium]|nr:hypothetical protein [Candidatus Sumerlaeaceae bacterium]
MTDKPASMRTPALPPVDPRQPFYFLHGDHEAAIERFKSAIVDAHLTPEQREENYREIVAPGTQPQLKRVLGELTAELATVSFLPDVKRVVTLYPVQDFYGTRKTASRASKIEKAGAGGRSPSDDLAEFIERELPHLNGVLICIAVEDYEKWRRISPTNPVVALAQRRGVLVAFRETGPQFAFFDALFARDTGTAIALWRDWWEATGGAPKMFYALVSQMRLLIQAKTASGGYLQSRGVTRAQFAQDFMPAEADKNLFALQPEWRREKLMKAAANFSFAELLRAYEKLSDLQKYAIPLNSDPYVPDKSLLAELWITSFTAWDA